MNLKLISFYDHPDGEGEFIAWTVLFTDLDRGRNMVATISMYPVCHAFDVEQLAESRLEAVEYPSGIVLGLVKTGDPERPAGG